MKRILMALALAAPLLAKADHIVIDSGSALRARAIRLAGEIRADLTAIETQAELAAEEARENGQHRRARRLEEVADLARDLARREAREVLRPLVNGVRLPAVARALDDLLLDVGELGEAVAAVGSPTPHLNRLVADLVLDLRRLRLLLDGGRL